jgi:triphosphatase
VKFVCRIGHQAKMNSSHKGEILPPAEGIATEIELKLTGPSKTLRRLLEDPIIIARATGELIAHRLRSVYYDTDERRLKNRGLVLRVRTDGSHFVQDFKDGAAEERAIAVRTEWSKPLPDAKPTLLNLGFPDLLDRVGLVLDAELEPVFTVNVDRTNLKITETPAEDSSTIIEIALDIGEISAGDRADPISELEMELLCGDPTALYRLALELVEKHNLRLETRSKGARGYTLVDGGWPVANANLPAISFSRNESGEEAFAQILSSTFAEIIANKSAAYVGRDIEGVHQLRVSMRRARTALSMYKSLLPVEFHSWLNTESRWLMGALGPAREIDVFLSESLHFVEKEFPDDSELKVVRNIAERHWRKSYETVRQAIHHTRFSQFVLKLALLGKDHTWWFRYNDGSPELSKPLRSIAGGFLAKRYKRVKKLGRDFDKASPAQRHDLRIAIKKLRYAAEFFASLYKQRKTKSFIKALKRLQSGLGAANDVAMSEKLLSDLVDDAKSDVDLSALHAGKGKIIGWHRHAQEVAETKLSDQWRSFTVQPIFWT